MPKFPYRGFTEKELNKCESNYWLLQVGGDFVSNGELTLFTQKELTKLYNEMLGNLIALSQDGSVKDRTYALDLIGSIRVIPFRLH